MASAVVCPICRGTGWSLRPEGALRCECQTANRGAELLAAAEIPLRYRHCTVENFDPQGVPALQRAHGRAAAYVRDYPGGVDRDRSGLLLYGPVGTGKTHLAVAIAQGLIERGIACRFCDHRALLKQIQATYDPSNPATEAGVVAPLLAVEVLILDDLGVGRATEWALETLHYILNHRYSQKLATILTTNLEDSGMRVVNGEKRAATTLVEAVGERLRSRLAEMCVFIELNGPDYRRSGRN